ncbi:hypothetical protein CEP54_002576 [Fusarium duplospermum]|uniref:Uncharacterized protein n=1 Tax=Fusarium duplospermum TaxID=1325734 RepID=A0A428QUF5_9HYPO|nr:hypothetical protein CEP54_002576 [Fusarium duplospermum]
MLPTTHGLVLRKDTFLLEETGRNAQSKQRGGGREEGWPHYFLFGMGLTRQAQKLGFWSFQTRDFYWAHHQLLGRLIVGLLEL